MALLRTAALWRLALRTQWASARLLSSVAAGGEPAGGVVELPGRLVDLDALRRERALRPPSERTQPARLRKVHGTPKATPEQVQLNADIIACASAEAVLDLATARLDVLNAVNLVTALHGVSKASGEGRPSRWLEGDVRFQQLLAAAVPLMEHKAVSVRDFPKLLFACAQLRIVPPDVWLQSFWQASGHKLKGFEVKGLSLVLHACGALSITPPDDWLQHYWNVSASKLDEYAHQDFSHTMFACGKLGITPPADWLELFWPTSAQKLANFTAHGFCNTLSACAQLDIRPPTDWRELFWRASAKQLGFFTPQDFSAILLACGQLAAKPATDWLRLHWHASALTLATFPAKDLSSVMHAYGKLKIKPPADWLHRYWHASASKLNAFVPQGLSWTLQACGKLGITPPEPWLQHYWHASSPKLGGFIPRGLSLTLLACAHVSAKPPSGWLQAFSASYERSLPDANQNDLGSTTLALTMLELWELPLWPGLWERLCQSFPRDTAAWSAEDQLNAQDLYQAYKAAAVERPGLLSEPAPELLAAAREVWLDSVRLSQDDGISMLHASVSACLTRMGIIHVNERFCERAERNVDIAVDCQGPGVVPVALEVSGVDRSLRDDRQNGRTLLRNRMLAAHGWRVVEVDYRTWSSLTTDEQREEHLRRLLE